MDRIRFDRFAERAQDSAMRAIEILQRYGHNQVDVEHLLLGLLEQPESTVTQILEKLGVDPEAMKERRDALLKASPKIAEHAVGAGQVSITPGVKRVLDQANQEAANLTDQLISTEHIFLGIACERGTPTDHILRDAGITKQRIHEAIGKASSTRGE